MPPVIGALRTLSPRSLSNLVFAIGVLQVELHHRVIEMVGLALCTQVRRHRP